MLRVYVKSALVISVITGIGMAVVLYATGVPVYLALGVLAGAGNMIPVVGGMVAVIVIVVVSLLTVGITRSLIVLVLYGAIQFGTDNILRPKLMAEGVGLHPVAIIVAIMIGGQFFGIVGVLIAVPVLAALRLAHLHGRSYFADDEHREDLDELAGPKKAKGEDED
jgi:predicted PurR-regulated permease PerM